MCCGYCRESDWNWFVARFEGERERIVVVERIEEKRRRWGKNGGGGEGGGCRRRVGENERDTREGKGSGSRAASKSRPNCTNRFPNPFVFCISFE